MDLAEQKAAYLGLRTFRTRNFPKEGPHPFYNIFTLLLTFHAELMKLGPTARSTLYVQLAPFPGHHLVLVITDDGFRYALIHVVPAPPEASAGTLRMEDIGWLDVERIRRREGSEGVEVGGAAVEDNAR